jgi:hypothetical protein
MRRKTLQMGWRIWHNEIHNEYVYPEIVRAIKAEIGGTVSRRV